MTELSELDLDFDPDRELRFEIGVERNFELRSIRHFRDAESYSFDETRKLAFGQDGIIFRAVRCGNCNARNNSQSESCAGCNAAFIDEGAPASSVPSGRLASKKVGKQGLMNATAVADHAAAARQVRQARTEVRESHQRRINYRPGQSHLSTPDRPTQEAQAATRSDAPTRVAATVVAGATGAAVTKGQVEKRSDAAIEHARTATHAKVDRAVQATRSRVDRTANQARQRLNKLEKSRSKTVRDLAKKGQTQVDRAKRAADHRIERAERRVEERVDRTARQAESKADEKTRQADRKIEELIKRTGSVSREVSAPLSNCPNCGKKLRGQEKFCFYCGDDLRGARGGR